MGHQRKARGLGPSARSIPVQNASHFIKGSSRQDKKLVSKAKRLRQKIHPDLRGLAELASEYSFRFPRDLGRVLARELMIKLKGKPHTEEHIAKVRESLTKQFLHQFPNDLPDKIEARVNKAMDMQFLLELEKIKKENTEK